MWGCLLRNVSAALNPAGPLPMAMKPAATTLLGDHFGGSQVPIVSDSSHLPRNDTLVDACNTEFAESKGGPGSVTSCALGVRPPDADGPDVLAGRWRGLRVGGGDR